jgi:hypothetical protein
MTAQLRHRLGLGMHECPRRHSAPRILIAGNNGDPGSGPFTTLGGAGDIGGGGGGGGNNQGPGAANFGGGNGGNGGGP